jgi:hypothetical protein
VDEHGIRRPAPLRPEPDVIPWWDYLEADRRGADLRDLVEIAKAEAFARYRARFGAVFDEALARSAPHSRPSKALKARSASRRHLPRGERLPWARQVRQWLRETPESDVRLCPQPVLSHPELSPLAARVIVRLAQGPAVQPMRPRLSAKAAKALAKMLGAEINASREKRERAVAA